MGIVDTKPITIPPWVRVAIALAVAIVLTLVAYLLTLDTAGKVGSKTALTGAIMVLPLVLATESGWPTSASFIFAFLTYFSGCLFAVWFFTREGRRPS